MDDPVPPHRPQRPLRRSRDADDFADPRDRDEDFESQRRRPRSRRNGGGGQGLLIGLIVGGVVLFVAGTGLAAFLLLRSDKKEENGNSARAGKDDKAIIRIGDKKIGPEIPVIKQEKKTLVGAWQPLGNPGFTRAEFTQDGRLLVTFTNRPLASATYKFVNANTIEIEEPNGFGGVVKTTANISLNGDDLTVTNTLLGTSVRYKRIQ
jgi:hypothetical protein